ILLALAAVGGRGDPAGANGQSPTSKAAGQVISPTGVLAEIARHPGQPNYQWGPTVPQPESDRTLAPYFVVAGGDGQERLPLEETSADVGIAGVIARVKVKQVFVNRGRAPIEAVYVFPASTRAAVHGMRMKIGARTIEARIDRKEAARES